MSTSMSEASSASEKATPLQATRREISISRPGAGVTTARFHSRGGEYINDPNGNILSPPILKRDDRPLRTMTIGRHTITVDSTSFQFNRHEFKAVSPHDHTVAVLFYTALQDHVDKLDELDEVLRNGHRYDPEWKWTRIPGWHVTPRKVTLLPLGLGIDTSSGAANSGTGQ